MFEMFENAADDSNREALLKLLNKLNVRSAKEPYETLSASNMFNHAIHNYGVPDQIFMDAATLKALQDALRPDPQLQKKK